MKINTKINTKKDKSKKVKTKNKEKLIEEQISKNGLRELLEKHERIILLFLFIFSLGLRLVYLNPGLFELDSIGLASSVEETYKTGYLHGIFNGRYGSVIVNTLTYIPYHLITGTVSAEKSIIFTDALFASLSIVVLFLFIKKIFNNNIISFVGALLFSISPIFLSVTTYGNSIGIETFFILNAFYLLISFHKNNSQVYLVFSSISIAFALVVKESALIFIPMYFLFYINPIIRFDRHFITLNREILKIRNLVSVLIPFSLIFGTYTYYVFYKILYKTLFLPDDGSGSIVKFLGFYSPVLSISFSDLNIDLSFLGIVLAITGIIIFSRLFENKFYFIFLLLWAGLFFYYGNTSVYSPYYLVMVSVAFFIFIAVSLNYLYDKNKILLIIGLLLLILIPFSYIQPILNYRHNFSGEKDCALWVKNEVPPGSMLMAMNDGGFYSYYGNLTVLSHPIGDIEKTKNWSKEINSFLENGSNIYIVDDAFSYDPDLIFLRTLLQNFDIENIGSHTCENYHKATIKDSRYTTGLSKVYRIITPEEINTTFNWNITQNGNKMLFDFTNTGDKPLINSTLKVDTMLNGEYYSQIKQLGDINIGESREIEIDPTLKNPLKILIWDENLNAWLALYRANLF